MKLSLSFLSLDKQRKEHYKMILLIDFGSQTAHLIARRVKEFGVNIKIITPEDALSEIHKTNPQGLIFSGGPADVYLTNSPTIDKKIFSLGIPILGICYGLQLIAHLLGGQVKSGKIKEYGPALLSFVSPSLLFKDIPHDHFSVWMSHGNEITKLPTDFSIIGETKTAKFAAVQNPHKQIYGLLFHPEVKHTTYGNLILRNFIESICKIKVHKKKLDLNTFYTHIKSQIKSGKALAAVSGGVDSTVAAALVARAIGKNLIPIYIDNGLMRSGTRDRIEEIFVRDLKVKPIIIDAQTEFLKNLKGVTDPETKRKIIGNLYIKLFERAAVNFSKVKFLIQGTIYSDVIESKGTKHASKIKSHHNVGGLPKNMKLVIFEPLRELYKDEVRKLGKKLGLPEEIVTQQPFPGPGMAIRIIGEVTADRLNRIQQADQIVTQELIKADWFKKVFQSFPVLTNTKSTAVKGDGRFYGEVIALRIYDSSDIMTASWTRLPYSILQKISSRIVNEVPGISRVVYDITTKPPATMEWE